MMNVSHGPLETSAVATGSFHAPIASGIGQHSAGMFATAGADQVETPAGDFVAVNDSLIFDSWDPTFAQMIDYAFASNLDPGNPFGSCEYMGFA